MNVYPIQLLTKETWIIDPFTVTLCAVKKNTLRIKSKEEGIMVNVIRGRIGVLECNQRNVKMTEDGQI